MNTYMKPIQIQEESPSEDTVKYALSFEHITHTFDKGTENEYRIFEDFTLRIEDIPKKSEIVSIMGQSGCGKSCLLRMAAGLMKPQAGEIVIHGEGIASYKSVPMVFQSYSSYEWMTVLENVSLPLVLKGLPKKEANEKAMAILENVGLASHATKYAKATVLSGGQLQRVSIARCLASGSKVFFLDEATGALDIKMKREIQDIILGICSSTEFETTIINVTHSIEEALYISDRIIVLDPNPCTIDADLAIDYGGQRGRWIYDTDLYRSYYQLLSSKLDK